MSITALVKVTVLGHTENKQEILADLQEIGCLHLIPLTTQGEHVQEQGPSPHAREALKFLLTCPQKRRQLKDSKEFDASAVQDKALSLQNRLQDLCDERDFLNKRIEDLKPWGDFEFVPLDELDGLRLWFYVIPHNLMGEIKTVEVPWEVVHRDNRFCYVVLISKDEPPEMPVPRVHTGAKPRHELEARLEQVEVDIEDAEAERINLTRWCLLFAANLDDLEDRAMLSHAASQTCDIDPVFAIQGWAPENQISKLSTYAGQHGLVLEVEDPDPSDDPPTLLENSPATSGGEDLVTFYMTPGYGTWDPSLVVFASFSVFFAMILSDAGYAAVLGLIAWYFWKPMGKSDSGKRLRIVFAALVGTTLAYGVITGGYFGIALPEDSFLYQLKLLDVTDAPTMMALSIFIGVGHVALGNLMDAYRLGLGKRPEALAPVGWAAITVGGLLLWLGIQQDSGSVSTIATIVMLLGAVLVLLFSNVTDHLGKRLLSGVMAFTKVTNAFGDVMSYLRLFALGLATASLAAAFNGMAAQVKGSEPGLGILAAALILIIGHFLNFVLAIMSAVVHGLRLNFIEFFNWGLKEEGHLYNAFKRKGTTSWTRSS